MPCIYYGDEIGMQGFGDPFCREYFKWNNINSDILLLFKELGRIKNKYKSLQYGSIDIKAEGDVLTVKRVLADETFTAIINMGDLPCKSDFCKAVISHGVSIVGDSVYIQKGGFTAFV